MKKVLEIGTGSGYQAAVLSQMVGEVYSVERILPLLEQARERFKQLKLSNIHTLYSDGNLGWPEHAPYDGIIVTAATPTVPSALLDQLADGGRLLLPLGDPGLQGQRLQLITRQGKRFTEESFDYVMFVPLLSGRTIE
jgi:protein-L-isoaspartate(D-aspartate) O-methyltransferase